MRLDPARTAVIVNPSAAGGRVGRKLQSVRERVVAALGDVRFEVSERPGHAVKLAERAAWEGAEVILSLGGDGTHSEVVSGLFRDPDAHRRVVVGFLPMGSGGDFRRLLDARGGLSTHLELVQSAEPVAVDVGLLHYVDEVGDPRTRVFLNECSVGMSATVCRTLASAPKRLGQASYLAGSIRAHGHHQPPTLRVRVDGQVVGEWLTNSIVICNGQYGGGGMHFAPRARLTDGLLDVLVVEHAGLVRLMGLSPSLYMGTAADHELVSSFRGFEVEVQVLTGGDAGVEADGDFLGNCPLRAHVVPNGIRLLGVRQDAL